MPSSLTSRVCVGTLTQRRWVGPLTRAALGREGIVSLISMHTASVKPARFRISHAIISLAWVSSTVTEQISSRKRLQVSPATPCTAQQQGARDDGLCASHAPPCAQGTFRSFLSVITGSKESRPSAAQPALELTLPEVGHAVLRGDSR